MEMEAAKEWWGAPPSELIGSSSPSSARAAAVGSSSASRSSRPPTAVHQAHTVVIEIEESSREVDLVGSSGGRPVGFSQQRSAAVHDDEFEDDEFGKDDN